jgi:hypothetical protein
MHPDLQSLLTLQEKDKAADALRSSLEALRPEEQALDDELAQLAQALADARRNVAGAEARRAELETRVQSYKQMQDRRKQQLEFVRGDKEKSSLSVEIDMARGVLVKEESDYVRSGDAISEAEKRVVVAEQAAEAATARQVEPRAAIAERRADLDAQLAAAAAERLTAAGDVPQPYLVKYERTRRGRAPTAVFPLLKDSCGHCFTAVPVQRRILLQQGMSIESCEVCGVLLYAAEV